MSLNDDILYGADAIAAFMGLSKRQQVYHHAAKGHIPTFRLGSMICARKSVLSRLGMEQAPQAEQKAEDAAA